MSAIQISAALGRINSLLKINEGSEEEEGLMLLRCHTQFRTLVYAYCRTHRIWASSIARTIEWSRSNAFEFYDAASGFLKARTIRAKRDSLHMLYHLTFADN